ncbi:MAG: DUF4251 domain-containing protein [Bacteroidales bacterium]
MKRIMYLASILFVLSSCATKAYIPKNEKEARKMEQVETAVANGDYLIEIANAVPMGGRLINLNGNYTVEVRNDSAFVFLPFYGRAYTAPMGLNDGGIKFNAPIDNYKLTTTKKGVYKVDMEIRTNQDSYRIYLEIMPDGTSTVRINSNNRSPMSYYGELEFDRE